MHISNHPFDPVQFGASKTTTLLRPYRIEPELCGLLIPLDVHMGRLLSIPGIEKEAIRATPVNRWHLVYASLGTTGDAFSMILSSGKNTASASPERSYLSYGACSHITYPRLVPRGCPLLAESGRY
jgi:hypothetical protein